MARQCVDCPLDHSFVDFATGDQLCWNEPPRPSRTVVAEHPPPSTVVAQQEDDIIIIMTTTDPSATLTLSSGLVWNLQVKPPKPEPNEPEAVYRKGGNASPRAVYNWPRRQEPTKLHDDDDTNNDKEEHDDCDCPYRDFATGDELCWVM
mmetsp:Transcript_21845/g.60734  ORF Transcript_21845/g.60734 Transcript_21845/m.60734 type:complete len:149 (+) Transcript_21845:183-629(+)